jgi:hypothetical protein
MGHLQTLVESANSEIKSLQESVSQRYSEVQKGSIFGMEDLTLSESAVNNTMELEYLNLVMEKVLLEMDIRDIKVVLEADVTEGELSPEEQLSDLVSQKNTAKATYSAHRDKISAISQEIAKLKKFRDELPNKIKNMENSGKSQMDAKAKEITGKADEEISQIKANAKQEIEAMKERGNSQLKDIIAKEKEKGKRVDQRIKDLDPDLELFRSKAKTTNSQHANLGRKVKSHQKKHGLESPNTSTEGPQAVDIDAWQPEADARLRSRGVNV